jgi:hypothetical protein
MARHRRTDPICDEFAGSGTVKWVVGIKVKSIRRWLYDRNRGRSCELCIKQFRADATARYFGGGQAGASR